MFLVMVVRIAGLPTAAMAQSLVGVEQQSRQCLQGGSRSGCSLALRQAEQLQERAAELQAFPCQTLLLGLQADLIMERDGQGRGAEAIADLPGILRGCVGTGL
ncbi:MAG: hypothetical protein ACPHGV_08740 [Synechococcus sp.]